MLMAAWDNLQVKGFVTGNIWNKLREIKMAIKKWYRLEGARDSTKISHLEEEIDKLEKRKQDGLQEEDIRRIVLDKKTLLWSLYRAEEQAWQQKSRVKWLQEEDRNTKFFHLMASLRRKVNYIDKLLVYDKFVDKLGELKRVIVEHFKSHFNKKHTMRLTNWDCNFKCLKKKNVMSLEQPFSEEELWGIV